MLLEFGRELGLELVRVFALWCRCAKKAKYPRCKILCGFYLHTSTSHEVSRRAARPYVMLDDPGAELAGVEFRVARGSRADDVVADHRVGH